MSEFIEVGEPERLLRTYPATSLEHHIGVNTEDFVRVTRVLPFDRCRLRGEQANRGARMGQIPSAIPTRQEVMHFLR